MELDITMPELREKWVSAKEMMTTILNLVESDEATAAQTLVAVANGKIADFDKGFDEVTKPRPIKFPGLEEGFGVEEDEDMVHEATAQERFIEDTEEEEDDDGESYDSDETGGGED